MKVIEFRVKFRKWDIHKQFNQWKKAVLSSENHPLSKRGQSVRRKKTAFQEVNCSHLK